MSPSPLPARDPDAERGRGKYEDAGGPSLKEAARLLDRYASDGPAQLDRLLAAATFTVLIGNADVHGKNLALLHPTPETVELAPLYDTVPTVLWPRLRARGAMSVNGRWELAKIMTQDLEDEAAGWPLRRERARRVVAETAEAVLVASAELDSDEPLARHVSARARALLAG